MKLRSKLIVMGILFLILPSLTIGIIGQRSATASLDDAGKIGLKNDVRMAIKLIHSTNEEVKSGNLSLTDAQEKIKTMLIGPMGADHKRPIDKTIDIGKNGYFFVLDKNGVEIAHPSVEGKSIWDTADKNGVMLGQEIIKNALNGGGYTYYQWPLPDSKTDAPKITYSELDPDWGWVVAAGSYMMDFNSASTHILHVIWITLVISLLLGTAALWMFSNYLSKPIQQIAALAKQVAQGDLTGSALRIKNKDEIGHLAQDFNSMTANLRKVIGQVVDSSLQVSSTSEQLAASSEQTSLAAEQIAQSIQEVAAGADTQLANTVKVSEVASNISEDMDTINENINTVTKASMKTAQTAVSGNQVIQKATEQMNIINQQSTDMVDRISVLGNNSNEIVNIVTLITTIANRTNILALNASIEAARAGEHGKGFAVVAGEIRKLAEQTGTAAGEINQLIQVIQKDIIESVSSMKQGDIYIKEGIIMINEAGKSFQDIDKDVDQVAQQLQQVIQLSQKIHDSKDQLVQAIEQVTQITKQSAENTQNVAAAAEEQNASMEEVSAAASTLAKIAEELHDSVKVFKV